MNTENSKRSYSEFQFSKEIHKALQLGTQWNRIQRNAALTTKGTGSTNTAPLLPKAKNASAG